MIGHDLQSMDRVGQVAYTIAAIAGGAVLSYYGPKWPRAVLAALVGATAIWILSVARRWHEQRQAAVSPTLALEPSASATHQAQHQALFASSRMLAR